MSFRLLSDDVWAVTARIRAGSCTIEGVRERVGVVWPLLRGEEDDDELEVERESFLAAETIRRKRSLSAIVCVCGVVVWWMTIRWMR